MYEISIKMRLHTEQDIDTVNSNVPLAYLESRGYYIDSSEVKVLTR